MEIFHGLDFGLGLSLVLALAFVLTFEFINGFHDTANAVATVIYTRAMPPRRAVILSGIFNFLGVVLGGVGVAYAIVHLLPVDLLINVHSAEGLAMIFSLLAAAILWNLGTWYVGIPASSSHTLIGALLGVGLANAQIKGIPWVDGINWKKTTDILLSLVISPTVGFVLAAVLLFALSRCWKQSKMHMTPEARRELDGKKHPPFWNRMVLVLSAMGMSYVHGSNDGQKGIGLIMLVLISMVPTQFVLNLNSTSYEINQTRAATLELQHIILQTQPLAKLVAPSATPAPGAFTCSVEQGLSLSQTLLQNLTGVLSYAALPEAVRPQVRRELLCLDDIAKKIGKQKNLTASTKADLERLRKDLTHTTEYAPLWVIFAVALALGIGTMVGWKRVVETVGEKIGRQGMTYAQGMSAQLVAVLSIGFANIYSLPVSTTHVLSSGVAGTMVANRSGLHGGTVRSILIAWVCTFPASMLLSAALFWLAHLWLSH